MSECKAITIQIAFSSFHIRASNENGLQRSIVIRSAAACLGLIRSICSSGKMHDGSSSPTFDIRFSHSVPIAAVIALPSLVCQSVGRSCSDNRSTRASSIVNVRQTCSTVVRAVPSWTKTSSSASATESAAYTPGVPTAFQRPPYSAAPLPSMARSVSDARTIRATRIRRTLSGISGQVVARLRLLRSRSVSGRSVADRPARVAVPPSKRGPRRSSLGQLLRQP